MHEHYRCGAARLAMVAIALFGLWLAPAPARDILPGPIPAQVLRVLDGDTLEVRARIWLGQDVTVRLRLAGVDAPERRGACAHERALAARAEALVQRLLSGDDGPARVTLREVRNGKYAGRVVARVVVADGTDLGAALLEAGLARPYDGGARAPWCAGTERR